MAAVEREWHGASGARGWQGAKAEAVAAAEGTLPPGTPATGPGAALELPATLPGMRAEARPELRARAPMRSARRRAWARWLSGAVLVLVLAVLGIGWGLGQEWLVRWRADYPAMVPATAIGLAVAALALMLQRAPGPDAQRWPGLLARGAGVFLLLWPLLPGTGLLPGFVMPMGDRMAIATRICLAMLGLGLLALPPPGGARRRALPQAGWRGRLRRGLPGRAALRGSLALLGFGFVSVPLMGYVFDATVLFHSQVFTAMAPGTGIGFALLYLALLLLPPARGPMLLLLRPGPGGSFIRRGLLPALLGPLACFYLARQATRIDWISVDFRLGLLGLLITAVALVALLRAGFWIEAAALRSRAARRAIARREHALLVARAEAEHAQRLAAIGRISGGVAHDFNNILAVVQGSLELIGTVAQAEDREALRQEALAAVQRGATLTRHLLAFSRKSPLAPECFDLGPGLAGFEAMLRRVLPSRIALALQLPPPGMLIRIDPRRLEQALLNLAINARDAMPEGGRLRLSATPRQLSPGHGLRRSDGTLLPPGAYLSLRLRDNGHGIAPEHLPRVHEPFYTTRGVGKGSGLGLSMAHGFAEQSGGLLQIRSVAGRGTEVEMLLPRLAVTVPVPGAGAVPGAVPGAALPILLVEDDPAVARTLQRVLEQAGHAVRCARDAREAEALRAEGLQPGLLICGQGLPGPVQGLTLIGVLRDRLGPVPALLLSGDPSHRLPVGTTMPLDVAMLNKPVDMALLLRHVALHLAPGTPPATGAGEPPGGATPGRPPP